jgi:DNA replication protein DnaD
MKLSNELKTAISQLPDKEKDKLLFRLIPKNYDLVAQLEFKLLEDGNTAEIRREELKEILQKSLKYAVSSFYSPGYLMMDLRSMSGAITQHVKTTKDKVGEVELNLLMLNSALKGCRNQLQNAPARKIQKFDEYVVKRAIKIMSLVDKIHEDYKIEFEDSIQALGKNISEIDSTKVVANRLGLDLNDLIEFG